MMRKISRLIAGVAAAALLGTSVMMTSLAATAPEYEGELVKQFYDNTWGNYAGLNDPATGISFMRLNNSAYGFIDALGVAQADGGNCLRVKLAAPTEAERQTILGVAADSNIANVMDLTGADLDTMALQFYIGIPSSNVGWAADAVRTVEMGLSCASEATTTKNMVHATLRGDISKYIDDVAQDGVWQHVTLPLSELKTFDQYTTDLTEFDWSKVSGVSFAVNADCLKPNNGAALIFDDIKLVKDIKPIGSTDPDPVTEAKVTGITFRGSNDAQITDLNGQDSVKAEVTLEHPADTESAVVVIASYTGAEGSYKLQNVSTADAALTDEQTTISTEPLTLSGEETLVKVFVWESFNSLRPWTADSAVTDAISK